MKMTADDHKELRIATYLAFIIVPLRLSVSALLPSFRFLIIDTFLRCWVIVLIGNYFTIFSKKMNRGC